MTHTPVGDLLLTMRERATALSKAQQQVAATVLDDPQFALRANVDAYNVFNGSAVLGGNNTYGPLWQQPASQLNLEVDSILPGRLIHFGGELTF